MKKIFITTLISIFAFNYSHSASILEKVNNEKHIFSSIDSIGYKNQPLKKFSVRKFLVLKILQRKLRKHLKKSGSIDTFILYNKDKKTFKWHWGGFFLGLFLPIIGILIAAFIKKDDRKWDRINSAAIATAILLLVLIFLALKDF